VWKLFRFGIVLKRVEVLSVLKLKLFPCDYSPNSFDGCTFQGMKANDAGVFDL
jgi:hypothetical protein